MDEGGKQIELELVPLASVAEALQQTLPFSGTNVADLGDVGPVERVTAPAGALLGKPDMPVSGYWMVLEGEIRIERPEPDGSQTVVGVARKGEGVGETPMLLGKMQTGFFVYANTDSVLVHFGVEAFWKLMSCCPLARAAIQADLSHRLHTHQAEALHREKLISLGTLAAGLMHELHNPGSAAKRASSQLRLNLLKLQEISLRFSDKPKTRVQMECMRSMLEHTMRGCQMPAMSSIEQADAEEEISCWLAEAGVENAYSIGPALVGVGLKQEDLICAKDAFDRANFSDSLNWLEALVSSVTLVCTIEESITRISELVMAVKKFAYDDKSRQRQLDVHDSLQSTLTILGHKLRIKGIQVEKEFSASPSIIETRGSSLSQVWTNLIDNALDASPANARIKIGTWNESANGNGAGNGAAPEMLAVSIEDHGEGISPEVLPRIFEAFFTTKPQGSGTGLGLEIVHRIVTQKFGGSIDVQSEPGKTRFVVRLPMTGAANWEKCSLPVQ